MEVKKYNKPSEELKAAWARCLEVLAELMTHCSEIPKKDLDTATTRCVDILTEAMEPCPERVVGVTLRIDLCNMKIYANAKESSTEEHGGFQSVPEKDLEVAMLKCVEILVEALLTHPEKKGVTLDVDREGHGFSVSFWR